MISASEEFGEAEAPPRRSVRREQGDSQPDAFTLFSGLGGSVRDGGRANQMMRWFPAMAWVWCSSCVKGVASRAIGMIAGAVLVACGTVFAPFEDAPDAGASDGSIADARHPTDVTSDEELARDVGTNDGRGGTGGAAGASGAAGSGNGGNAGAGGAAGAGGVGGNAGAGGSAGRDAGGSGASIAVQGHIGAIGMATSPIGNVRVVYQRITTSRGWLCNGSICVRGGLAP